MNDMKIIEGDVYFRLQVVEKLSKSATFDEAAALKRLAKAVEERRDNCLSAFRYAFAEGREVEKLPLCSDGTPVYHWIRNGVNCFFNPKTYTLMERLVNKLKDLQEYKELYDLRSEEKDQIMKALLECDRYTVPTHEKHYFYNLFGC